MSRNRSLHDFFNEQLSRWPAACENYRALKNVERKYTVTGGLGTVVQYNPGRIVSTSAQVDEASVRTRRCFLCAANRPAEQIKMDFEGRKGKKYHILVNPYPIFPEHFVFAAASHCDQLIAHRYVDMLDMAAMYQDYVFLYNGPACGASAPDHFHFQAGKRNIMPLEKDADEIMDSISGMKIPDISSSGAPVEYIASVSDAELFRYGKFARGIFLLRAVTVKSAAKLFYRLLDCADTPDGSSEPMFNLLSYRKNGEYRSIIIMRSAHRSHHYHESGERRLMVSPGCADMAGLFITPRREDFVRIDNGLIEEIVGEVTLGKESEERLISRMTRTQPRISVGIMSAEEISFEIFSDGAGIRKVRFAVGKIEYDGMLYDELYFEEQTMSTMFARPTFSLHDVTIGVDFHWQRKERQVFAGSLKFIVTGDTLTAVNIIGVEDYLLSVISSEMNVVSSLELLKAHAVISRSWLMALLERKRASGAEKVLEEQNVSGKKEIPGGYVRWYGHEDHDKFDVCADDHCQRYQGLSREIRDIAAEAVDSTWGMVLTYEGGICDARFSKCCGGIMEEYGTCWEDRDVPYLSGLSDTADGKPADMSSEQDARAWITGNADNGCRPFCSMADRNTLAQVLNDYDLETEDYYRWEVVYDRQYLARLISSGTGIGIGELLALRPLSRGHSGRIDKLGITGSEASFTVGKELEIRRILSDTHLKSSAFVIDYLSEDGKPVSEKDVLEAAGKGFPGFSKIRLRGAGWGHGVGLCQIGAAVMAREGYGYESILAHYYPGSALAANVSK